MYSTHAHFVKPNARVDKNLSSVSAAFVGLTVHASTDKVPLSIHLYTSQGRHTEQLVQVNTTLTLNIEND